MCYSMLTEVCNMFTYVKLKNFLSFGEVTFDFKQKANIAKKFVSIYGENGSGKSNFVRSIDLLCHTLFSFDRANKTAEIEDLLKNSETQAPIEILNRLIEDGDIQKYIAACRMIDCDEPTEVEYGFLLNGREGYYRLKFSDKFSEETLYYFTGKQRGVLFSLSTNGEDDIITERSWSGLYLDLKAREEMQEDISKYWGKHTFLGILMQQINSRNAKYIRESFSEYLLDVVNLFWDTTVISKKSNHHNTGIISKKPCNVLDNLRSGKISKSQLPQLECSERILRDFFTQTYADIKDVVYEKEIIDGEKIKYSLYVDKMIAGKSRHISFENESAGTQQILDIVKMLLGLFCGVTVVYDEIDDGIHDILLNNIIHSLVGEISGQLIITTHNTLLLESISTHSAYVICVDHLGNKEVKCISEFGIQNNNNARIKYLKGMFGGTPYLDGIDYDAILEELEDVTEVQ